MVRHDDDDDDWANIVVFNEAVSKMSIYPDKM